MLKCDGTCPNRHVGCRTGCPTWEAEEARKEERYAARQKEREGRYTAINAMVSERIRVAAIKQGRRLR